MLGFVLPLLGCLLQRLVFTMLFLSGTKELAVTTNHLKIQTAQSRAEQSRAEQKIRWEN
jgi:hypothetical protein